jgi:exopolyphosphatase/guanosine-5'-triphosphate,3'-diphosphate pyrophosphatase
MNKEAVLQDVEVLLRKYETEPEHVRHVARLALHLFDSLAAWHGRGEKERVWLEAASLLHDIGWSQAPDGGGHHKESARLIEKYAWRSLDRREARLVAQVARYHRKSLPAAHHRRYQEMESEDRQRVHELGGILRIADAFDRTHRQVVKGVRAEVTAEFFCLSVEASEAWNAEREMVKRKQDLLEVAAGRKVVFAGEEPIR